MAGGLGYFHLGHRTVGFHNNGQFDRAFFVSILRCAGVRYGRQFDIAAVHNGVRIGRFVAVTAFAVAISVAAAGIVARTLAVRIGTASAIAAVLTVYRIRRAARTLS